MRYLDLVLLVAITALLFAILLYVRDIAVQVRRGMMIRGIDRAHDIECGPSSGMHTRGAIGGAIVKPLRGRSSYASNTPEYRRAYRESVKTAEQRDRSKTTVCGLAMPKSGALCARRSGHANHCRSRKHLDNQMVARASRESVDTGRKR